MSPKANQIYRHFKGNLYKVITVAVHTETEEELVIYQALYGDFKVYARPLSMFISEVDKEKYPLASQKLRFEPVEQIVEAVDLSMNTVEEDGKNPVPKQEEKEKKDKDKEQESNREQESNKQEKAEESISIDPMLEAYLDTDSYRERLNILRGLQHRITEHMLNVMAIVIDFELPEGDIQTQYDALNDCLVTKERYECNRVI